MRGVALAARELGYTVTGTDPGAGPPATTWLKEQGLTCWEAADPAHLAGVDKVIISGHTQADDPEVAAATERGIPIQSFAAFVGEFTTPARTIVVAGTHGKTTTASLLAWIFDYAGRNPDYLIGIKPHNFASSVRLTGAPLAILEGDEYRASQLENVSKFTYYHPDVLVLTSIEMDHPDFFKNISDVTARFADLAGGLPEDGRLVYWGEHRRVQTVAKKTTARRSSYGFHGTDWQPAKVSFTPEGLQFLLTDEHQAYGELTVPLFGRHNVLNTLAAAAVALGEGVTMPRLQRAVASFKGASRRFEFVSDKHADVRVIDDYAHHPSEVATTIEAAQLHFPGRVLAIFRPHTYSRTKELLREYQQCFAAADVAVIAPIEPARETHLAHTVSGADIARQAGDHVTYAADRESVVQTICEAARPGDTILSMTVNGYDGLAADLARRTARL